MCSSGITNVLQRHNHISMLQLHDCAAASVRLPSVAPQPLSVPHQPPSDTLQPLSWVRRTSELVFVWALRDRPAPPYFDLHTSHPLCIGHICQTAGSMADMFGLLQQVSSKGRFPDFSAQNCAYVPPPNTPNLFRGAGLPATTHRSSAPPTRPQHCIHMATISHGCGWFICLFHQDVRCVVGCQKGELWKRRARQSIVHPCAHVSYC